MEADMFSSCGAQSRGTATAPVDMTVPSRLEKNNPSTLLKKKPGSAALFQML